MNDYLPYLNRMAPQAVHYVELLRQWARIDTRTGNRDGLEAMLGSLRDSFSGLGGMIELPDAGVDIQIGPGGRSIDRPLGRAFRMIKRPAAGLRVLLCGHMDAVLGPQGATPPSGPIDEMKLYGSGALDGKGGLAVMLAALECLESFPQSKSLGWEVLIAPDEEIGSPGSEPLLRQAAGRCRLGLLFEPALADGSLVGSRSGSGNFTLVVHGRSAHAGRQPEAGRNAIEAMADFIIALRQLPRTSSGIRINVGAVEGGGPLNVVPDLALCRFNVRAGSDADMAAAQKELARIVRRIESIDGIRVELSGRFGRPPKLLDGPTGHILESLAVCGRELGLAIRWQATGGVCDGNTLAAAGLPNVDSLGPVGDGMHTAGEYVQTASILERARLTALFLMKLACGDIVWPPPRG